MVGRRSARRPMSRNSSAGRIGGGGQATVRRVLRASSRTSPPSGTTSDSAVVASATPKYTHQPAGTPSGRNALASITPAYCSSPTSTRRVAELGRRRSRLRVVPAEHVAVERERRLVLARVQLEPARRARLAARSRTRGARPAATCRSPRRRRRRRRPSARAPSRPSPAPSPGPRARPPRATVASASSMARYTDQRSGTPASPSLRMHPATRLALELEVLVAAVVRARILDRPAEQAAVELLAAVGVGGQQVDPAGGPRVGDRHASATVAPSSSVPAIGERSPGSTVPSAAEFIVTDQATGSRITTGIRGRSSSRTRRRSW